MVKTKERKKHALLSPSSAHRWIACPPIERLEMQEESKDTEYSKEGSLAHEIAEYLISVFSDCKINLKDIKSENFLDNYFSNIKLPQELTSSKYYSIEMLDYVQEYVLYVYKTYKCEIQEATIKDYKLKKYNLAVEQQINLNRWVPKSFGTVDSVITTPTEITVFDFKYGQGIPVSAYQNPQLMLYALGVYNALSTIRAKNIIKINLIIHQPRLDNISKFTLPVEEILYWAENYLRPRAYQAFKGIGDWNFRRDIMLWSKVAGKLITRAAENIKIINLFRREDVKKLNEKQINNILKKLPEIKLWISQVEQHAINLMKNENKDIPDFTLKEGRKTRKIQNHEGLKAELISRGYKEDDFLKTDLKNLTYLEKLIGKEKFNEEFKSFITYSIGKEYISKKSKKTKIEEKEMKKLIDSL